MSPDGPRRKLENRLIRSLPRQDRQRLEERLEPVYLPYLELLYGAGVSIPHVHFPTNCVLSLLAETPGGAVEVAAVGNEGLAGLPLFLGGDGSSARCVVQIPGDALRLRAGAFREEVRRSGALRDLLLRYTLYRLDQAARTVACNRRHSVAQRLCRWILAAQDRVGSDWFPLTQALMAQLIGVRRTTAGLAAGALQRAGLIRYSRGKLTVLDRRRLEAAACECHTSLSRELETLLGPAQA